MPVLFLSGEPRVGQSVSGVGDKECTSADSFNTIIDPMKSLPTFNYNYMPICVNNFMIKYTSLLGDPAFSLQCTTVFPLSERDNTFCYSLILSFLPHPFPELMPARKNSEKKIYFILLLGYTTLWYFLPFSLITTSSPWRNCWIQSLQKRRGMQRRVTPHLTSVEMALRFSSVWLKFRKISF